MSIKLYLYYNCYSLENTLPEGHNLMTNQFYRKDKPFIENNSSLLIQSQAYVDRSEMYY